MTLIAVPIFVDEPSEVADGLARAEAAVARGARMIEWRVDELAAAADAETAVATLVKEAPAPCIVTVRSDAEGGRFLGTPHELAELMARIASSAAMPRYLDVELAAVAPGGVVRNAIDAAFDGADDHAERSGVILSSHDFTQRPADLLQKIEAMTNDRVCDVIKVAWLARSLRDNLEAFDLLAERRKPMIASCMGPFGLMSRVLAPKFGGLITFATDDANAPSAPGQPTIAEILGRYRFDAIGERTKVYGVIGWPVEHSRSPDLHNTGFTEVGHDGVYLPLPIPAEYEHFKATVDALIEHPRLDFAGASVTLPHKTNLLRFVRERGGAVDPAAERVGAANTLVIGADRALACANSDAPAAVASLAQGMEIGVDQLRGRRVAVMGTGGVARAVVAGLSDAGAVVVVAGRDPDKAALLAVEFDAEPCDLDTLATDRFEVYVNCTPLGMEGGPDPDGCPLPPDAPIDDSTTVFDTVYAPPRTPLVRDAEARGARIVTGVEMFLLQASLQFERWTGEAAPLEAWRRLMESG